MKNVIFAGVGGQGVILASKVLMEVARKRGLEVKESEVHGMAQRGGSVECNVRFGKEVFSPLIPKGGADYVVSLELLESMRKIDYLKKDAVLIVNREQINPAPVEIGAMEYPADIEEWLTGNFANTVVVDTTEALKEAGTKKALNIVMLGCLSKYLDFELGDWENAIKHLVNEKFLEQNLKAFTLGRELIKL
ncbi:MAG TPA: indolepyruvate oxidoreductase subunit beta [Spirochaetota bacterium]|nr:indolepyruvate oxidoreductase subunit beta [Spirochaetota bacterium]HPJ36081.1 indolepyruvate oxidoreductase subunit beta [Spirochaetota bacterium]